MLNPNILLKLYGFDVFRFQPFFALLYIKRYALAFIQGFEAFGLNRAEMHENISALILLDEAEPFVGVEPFYFPFWHSYK